MYVCILSPAGRTPRVPLYLEGTPTRGRAGHGRSRCLAVDLREEVLTAESYARSGRSQLPTLGCKRRRARRHRASSLEARHTTPQTHDGPHSGTGQPSLRSDPRETTQHLTPAHRPIPHQGSTRAPGRRRAAQPPPTPRPAPPPNCWRAAKPASPWSRIGARCRSVTVSMPYRTCA